MVPRRRNSRTDERRTGSQERFRWTQLRRSAAAAGEHCGRANGRDTAWHTIEALHTNSHFRPNGPLNSRARRENLAGLLPWPRSSVSEMANGDLTRREFERVVGEALESLPKRFAELVENVVIAVEEEPTDEDLDSIEDDGDDSELLGIYRGVALTERTHDMPLLPDEIAIFRGPINRIALTREEAVLEVRETVIHELGHYFGLHDEEMPH